VQSPGDSGRPLKVLHVDDDPMNLRVVQEILGAEHLDGSYWTLQV